VTLRDLAVLFVPRSWSGAQALAAAGTLQRLIEAIWQVHGEAMAAVLFADDLDEPAVREQE
jgi:hypothetical protein